MRPTKLKTFFAALIIALAISPVLAIAGQASAQSNGSLPPTSQISVEQLATLLKNKQDSIQLTLIDARSEKSYMQSHIPSAISIYDKEFDKHSKEKYIYLVEHLVKNGVFINSYQVKEICKILYL